MKSIDVLEREREFHNNLVSDHSRAHQVKYYSALRGAQDQYAAIVMQTAANAVTLDYGCATGSWTLRVAKVAKAAYGIDISDVSVGEARKRAEAEGFTNVTFTAGDAQAMDFPDGTFDLVHGSGIVHHLETERAAREISRVLKPGGRAVFIEPLGHNPLINLYRHLTPKARTVDEHPLKRADFQAYERYFSVDARFFGLTSLAAVPFRNFKLGAPLRALLDASDAAITRIPGAKWHAWSTLMVMTKLPG